jgi:glucosamine--fructose-6-phosphate aminotransferase (isomerizing)
MIKGEKMNTIEAEIRSTPAILRRTYARVAEHKDALAALFGGPVVLLGCGTSYCVGLAAAASYEWKRRVPAQAIIASDFVPRKNWAVVAISRTGQTTELLRAMDAARTAGAPVLLLAGEMNSLAEQYAGTVLPLEFASEEGVVQTRFITAAIAALRAVMLDEEEGDLPRQMEQSLAAFDPTPLLHFEHVVFLGRGPQYGLACAAAVNLQETSLLVPEAHHTLDYRHGPIAAADANTLVWAFDAPGDTESAAVLDDVRKTGATVYAAGGNPLITLVQAQLVAYYKAQKRHLDPASPRHLARAIIL